MPRFLIDVNLPYRFSLWAGEDYVHMRDIGETWTDTEVWRYARRRQNLIIVSKDADFSDRVMVSVPPPRVVHIRFGNMRMRDFHGLIARLWPRVMELSLENKLVRVYRDRIEAIE
jgi:predicted nuclease of predicted toxin-antitoxin system